MECPRCKASNPDGKRFCGDCGSMLDQTADQIRREVVAVVRESFKDQNLLALETADKAVGHLWFYGKLVGIPVAAVALALGIFGVRSFRDAMRLLKSTRDAAITSMGAARDEGVGYVRQSAVQTAEAVKREGENTVASIRNLEVRQNLPSEFERARQEIATYRERLAKAEDERRRIEEERARLATDYGNFRQYTDSAIGKPNDLDLKGRSSFTTSIPTPDLPTRIHTIGSEGAEVEKIQQRLRAAGCYSGAVTGKFDEQTAEAVVRFKKANANRTGFLRSWSKSSDASDGAVDFSTYFDLAFSAFTNPCSSSD